MVIGVQWAFILTRLTPTEEEFGQVVFPDQALSSHFPCWGVLPIEFAHENNLRLHNGVPVLTQIAPKRSLCDMRMHLVVLSLVVTSI